jgi:FtsH-binding integral membrane protein
MAIGPENRTVYRTPGQAQALGIDQGLRAYMLGVYNYMGGGLILTGALAYAFASTPALWQLLYHEVPGGIAPTGLGYVVMFAPLAIILFLQFKIQSMSTPAVQATYWIFTAAMGASLTYVGLLYTGESIARTFFVCAATFLGMSLYGYTTKRDLSGMGHFLIMGVWGLFVAMLVNMFLHSSGLNFAISALGVLIFTGLTAYDTQAIKSMYLESDGRDVAAKKSVMGAVKLYLDFVNLFLFMLRFMGNRR